MIKIRRPSTPPDPDTAEKLRRGAERISTFLKNEYRQTRFDFSIRFYGKAREALKEIQHGKCAYCESAIGVTSHGQIENFRPRSQFPQLAYEWDNLLICCQICKVNKSNKFPTSEKGETLLIDPSHDEPSESIFFDNKGFAIPKDIKGEVTIRTIALNRPDLVAGRKDAIRKYRASASAYPADEVVYAGAIRSVYGPKRNRVPWDREVLTERAVVRPIRARAVEKTPDERQEFSYISSVRITNFRALAKIQMDIPFLEGVPGWQVLLGENSAGKSTVLKAIAIALMGKDFLPVISAYQSGILRRSKAGPRVTESRNGSITITFVNGKDTTLKFSRSGLRFEKGGKGMDGCIRGYGSMRLLPESNDSSEEMPQHGVTNLFQPRQSLINTETLLTELYSKDREKFEKFATHIRFLLGLKHPIDVIDGKLSIPVAGIPTSISELSDGYQAMVALAADLMNRFKDFRSMETEPGILLLDELGTHLHPRWRLEFVERLRSTFTGLQVFATTHEPLCLRGLKKGEICLLQRDQEGNVEFINDDSLPDIEAMRVDQILTSPIFGLHSTIDPKIEARFIRYYELLAKHNLTAEEEDQCRRLANDLKPQRHLAYTRRDQLMYHVIDKFLAEEALASRGRQQKLKDSTIQKLRNIWNDSGVPGTQGAL